MNINATRFATHARTWLLIAGLTALLIYVLVAGSLFAMFSGEQPYEFLTSCNLRKMADKEAAGAVASPTGGEIAKAERDLSDQRAAMVAYLEADQAKASYED
jgi:hypothetical protein